MTFLLEYISRLLEVYGLLEVRTHMHSQVRKYCFLPIQMPSIYPDLKYPAVRNIVTVQLVYLCILLEYLNRVFINKCACFNYPNFWLSDHTLELGYAGVYCALLFIGGWTKNSHENWSHCTWLWSIIVISQFVNHSTLLCFS